MATVISQVSPHHSLDDGDDDDEHHRGVVDQLKG